MRRGEEPDKDTWQLHEARVEMYCSTLERARKCAENPNYTTSSEVEKGKGRRKKKMYHRNYTSSSGSSSELTPPPTPKSSAADYRGKNGAYDLPQTSTSEETGKSGHLDNTGQITPNTPDELRTNTENVHNIQDLYETIESLKRICLKNQKMLEDLHLCMKSVQNEGMHIEKLNDMKKNFHFKPWRIYRNMKWMKVTKRPLLLL